MNEPTKLNKKEKLTVKKVAVIMKESEQFIRIGLQRSILPFGFATQMSGKRFKYYINPKDFYEYIGEENI